MCWGRIHLRARVGNVIGGQGQEVIGGPREGMVNGGLKRGMKERIIGDQGKARSVDDLKWEGGVVLLRKDVFEGGLSVANIKGGM